jgi:hypothetical protein
MRVLAEMWGFFIHVTQTLQPYHKFVYHTNCGADAAYAPALDVAQTPSRELPRNLFQRSKQQGD